MKQSTVYKILVIISIIVLLAVIYNYIRSYTQMEHFIFEKPPPTHYNSIEEEYEITNTTLDKDQTLCIWKLPFIKKHIDKGSLPRLFGRLRKITTVNSTGATVPYFAPC